MKNTWCHVLLEIYACLEFSVNSERARSYKSRRTSPLHFIRVNRYFILKYMKNCFSIVFKISDQIRPGSNSHCLSDICACRLLYQTCIYIYIREYCRIKRKNRKTQYGFIAMSIYYVLIILRCTIAIGQKIFRNRDNLQRAWR